ncbi:MAG: sugar transferase [Opitutaceae bacterium]
MKRLFDILLTLLGLSVLCLPLLVLGIVQFIKLGSPIFFRQQRAGYHGKAFSILKFRTMRNGTGSDEARMLPWGQFLRSTSLDELPELWNVLIGEMSLVGPRPLPTSYLDRYTAKQARRHDVRPGITGWAQVNGRNGLTWEKQFELDQWYVDNHSFLLDLKILWLTIWTVISRKNISAEGHVTRGEFFGSQTPPTPDHTTTDA